MLQIRVERVTKTQTREVRTGKDLQATYAHFKAPIKANQTDGRGLNPPLLGGSDAAKRPEHGVLGLGRLRERRHVVAAGAGQLFLGDQVFKGVAHR